MYHIHVGDLLNDCEDSESPQAQPMSLVTAHFTTSLIVWVRIGIVVAFMFSIKQISFTLVGMRLMCLLMKSGFYLVFIISIIKWKVLVNKSFKSLPECQN